MTVIYAFTVILGAALLFLVQPLIAKLILPWFGGTSAVWSAALMFFQICVFGGYAYAHVISTSLKPRAQALVHASLVVIACATMPILPSPEWRPAPGSAPALSILLLLTATVGLPALLLSATSPLLQVWYMRRSGSEPPYWLYALSNVGSLVALLGFPVLLEPSFDTRTLALAWSGAFGAFALASIGTAWMSRRASAAEAVVDTQPQLPPSAMQMLLWLSFSACGSALLVSVSAHLTVNVAPIPLLWVLPLALYLLTFILNFGSRRFYNRALFFPWLVTALGCITYLYMKVDVNPHIGYAIPLYLVSLFVICMACHGELVLRRPQPRYLTRFYLLIALGGALGGSFVAVIAPLVFESYWELPIVLIVIAELMVFVQWRRRGPALRVWLVRGVMVAGVLALATFLVLTEVSFRDGYLLVERNFYGVLRVRDYEVGTEYERRTLFNGTISHGYQYRSEPYRDLAGAYYSTNSGIARAILALQAQGPVNLGVIGMGAGVLATYAREHDSITLYEIDPEVVRIANEYFDVVPRARARGADVSVVLGDARLSLERQPPQAFDVLAVDAFSSDAIPVHLLTQEAIETYLRHLRPNGVLAVHISNRYLDLLPVCQSAAERVGRFSVLVEEPADMMAHASSWVLITSDLALLKAQPFAGAQVLIAAAPAGFKGWTDQYSNVWSVLKLGRKEESTVTAAAH